MVNNLQYPTDIVLLVVLWRFRYKLSLRDLVEMFGVRGYTFTHETVREWDARCAPELSQQLKAKRRGEAGKSWYVDETYVKVNEEWHYLYRAIDGDGNLVDTMLSPTRDLAAARAFFKQAVETVGYKPERVTTDGNDAYPRAIHSRSTSQKALPLADQRRHFRQHFNDLMTAYQAAQFTIKQGSFCLHHHFRPS